MQLFLKWFFQLPQEFHGRRQEKLKIINVDLELLYRFINNIQNNIVFQSILNLESDWLENIVEIKVEWFKTLYFSKKLGMFSPSDRWFPACATWRHIPCKPWQPQWACSPIKNLYDGNR
jgi:hypothetical protein